MFNKDHFKTWQGSLRKPNIFIGGEASNYQTPFELSNTFGFSGYIPHRIYPFRNLNFEGDNMSFYMTAFCTLFSHKFQGPLITYLLDVGGKINISSQGVFKNCTNLEYLHLPILEEYGSGGGYRGFNILPKLYKYFTLPKYSNLNDEDVNEFLTGTPTLETIDFPKLENFTLQQISEKRRSLHDLINLKRLNIPLLTNLDIFPDPPYSIRVLSNVKEYCTIVCNSVLEDYDSLGNRHPVIEYVEDIRNADVRYKLNEDLPNPVSDLSISEITSVGCKFNFTPPPINVNSNEYYEIWADDKNHIWKNLIHRDELDEPNTAVFDFDVGTEYEVTAITRDYFFNKSEHSNSVKFKTANTFLGMVQDVLTTPSLLLDRIDNNRTYLTESDIENFTIHDTFISFYVGKEYKIDGDAFYRDTSLNKFPHPISYYMDLQNKVTNIGGRAFDSQSQNWNPLFRNLKQVLYQSFHSCNGIIYLPHVEGITEFTQNNPPGFNAFQSSKLTRLYLPRCILNGDNELVTGMFNFGTTGTKIYIDPYMLTANSGLLEADLQWAVDNKAAELIPVTDFTPPLPIINLGVNTLKTNSIKVTLGQPAGSVNTVDFYEVWLEEVNSFNPQDKHFPQLQEISGSNQFIEGLKTGTDYRLKLATVDEFYNGSGLSETPSFSNIVKFSTPAHNTFIGGVQGVLNTPILLLDRIDPNREYLNNSDIQDLTIHSDHISFYVEKEYNIAPQAFNKSSTEYNANHLRFYIDTQGKVLETGFQCFRNQTLFKPTNFPGLTFMDSHTFQSQTGNAFFPKLEEIGGVYNNRAPGYYAFRNTNFDRIYLANCEIMGNNAGDSQLFRVAAANDGCRVYVHPSLLTSYNGGLDFDLNYYAVNSNAIIIAVTDFTPPKKVIDLSISDITSTSIKLNFTPPIGSTTPIDFYEVWLEKIEEFDPTNSNVPQLQEITSSGEIFTGLVSGTKYRIKLATVDEFYNGSGLQVRPSFSNRLTFTTL